MSIASEITRLQNAKASLKTSINAKSTTQITNETLEDYASFVDNIPSGGSSHDWSAIGYSSEPASINEDYLTAKDIYDNWDVSTTSGYYKFGGLTVRFFPFINTQNLTTARGMFSGCICLVEVPLLNISNVSLATDMFNDCKSLKKVPLLNTSNVTNMQNMFYNCGRLEDVPIFNTSKVTNFISMFQNCTKLTDTSLDNILQMCIGATSYSNVKTLARLGFASTYYSASRIQALPHYQDFTTAGWTIGY